MRIMTAETKTRVVVTMVENLSGERSQRMTLDAEVLLLRQGELWESEVIDISASGVRIRRPVDFEGKIGDQIGLELLLGKHETIGVFGSVCRIDEHEVAFEYSRIPVRSEIPLWNLLGIHADTTEITSVESA